MRRLPAILLLIAFAALGSGLLEDLHLRAHLKQNALSPAGHVGHTESEPADPHAGESDGCELCAHLHVGRISAGWVSVMICLGVFVAFLTQLSPRLAPQGMAAPIDCRGPPAL